MVVVVQTSCVPSGLPSSSYLPGPSRKEEGGLKCRQALLRPLNFDIFLLAPLEVEVVYHQAFVPSSSSHLPGPSQKKKVVYSAERPYFDIFL